MRTPCASFLLLAALAALVACGGKVVEPVPDQPDQPERPDYDVTHDPLAQRMATALVEYKNRCRLEDDWIFDSTRVTENRRDVLASRYDAMLAAPHVSGELDAWVERCAAALETGDCRHLRDHDQDSDDLRVMFGTYFDLYAPVECTSRPLGALATGAVCIDSAECSTGSCRWRGDCGICSPRRLNLGDACDLDDHEASCVEGSHCAGTCMQDEQVELGTVCDLGHRCAPGSYCASETPDREVRTCQPQSQLGESCQNVVDGCVDGLVCERFPLGTEVTTRVCIVPSTTLQPRGELGAACDTKNPCHTELACNHGRCEAPSDLGEDCAAQICAAGLTCVAKTREPGELCVKRPEVGQPCLTTVLQGDCAAGLRCADDRICRTVGTESCR